MKCSPNFPMVRPQCRLVCRLHICDISCYEVYIFHRSALSTCNTGSAQAQSLVALQWLVSVYLITRNRRLHVETCHLSTILSRAMLNLLSRRYVRGAETECDGRWRQKRLRGLASPVQHNSCCLMLSQCHDVTWEVLSLSSDMNDMLTSVYDSILKYTRRLNMFLQFRRYNVCTNYISILTNMEKEHCEYKTECAVRRFPKFFVLNRQIIMPFQRKTIVSLECDTHMIFCFFFKKNWSYIGVAYLDSYFGGNSQERQLLGSLS